MSGLEEKELLESKFNPGGTIVLTKNDINRIRNYEVLEYHFHGLQFHHGRITFFISNSKSVVTQDSNLGKNAMLDGEVCPIIVDEEQMKILKNGDRILSRTLPCVPPFKIDVCTSKQWHDIAMEQNKDGNK